MALTFGRITGVQIPLALLLRREKYELVHLHEHLKTSLFGTCPSVMHFHNDPLSGADAEALAREAPAYWAQVGKSLRQIGVSDYVAKRLRRIHDLAGATPDANILKIPNGVHADAMPAPARAGARRLTRERLGLKETDVVFLFSGALRPEKGVDFLARAFARTLEQNSNARLLIVGGGGSGSRRDGCSLTPWTPGSGRSRTSSPGDRAQAGPSARPRAARRNHAVLCGERRAGAAFDVSGDVRAGHSGSLSMGLPVVAFRSGGIPELVENGRNGVIVEQGDEEGLYRAMSELARDRALRERLGAAGEQTARRYPWEYTVDQLDDIYLSVMEKSAKLGRLRPSGPHFGREAQ